MSISRFGGGDRTPVSVPILARREIRVMFEELLRRLPDTRCRVNRNYLQSNFIHGIKRCPCRSRRVSGAQRSATTREEGRDQVTRQGGAARVAAIMGFAALTVCATVSIAPARREGKRRRPPRSA